MIELYLFGTVIVNDPVFRLILNLIGELRFKENY